MKKYLVLGGNGFIGRSIVKKLSLKNEVIIADRNFEKIYDNDNVSFRELDFVSCNDFSPYLEDVDIVIHLISTIGPNDRIDNIKNEIKDNVFPTVQLLDDMVKCDTKKIVFISSGGTVYGEHVNKPIYEYEKKNPICHYGVTKDLIEKYLQLYNLYEGIDYRIIRLANPYSEFTKSGKSQGIVPIFIDQLLNNEEIKIWGDGNAIRDYIYIDDAVSAIIKIINYDGKEKIFNVGTGKGYTINEVIDIICKELNISFPNVVHLEKRKCDVGYNVLNIDKISNELGWEPKVSLESGIKRTIRKKIKGDYYGKERK